MPPYSRDPNQEGRDRSRRVDYDPRTTNIALAFCDECGCHLTRAEKRNHRILRASKPLDFAGRGRDIRERLVFDRPKSLVAKCTGCWREYGRERQAEREANSRRYRVRQEMKRQGAAVNESGSTIGTWMKDGGHDVEGRGLIKRINIRG